MQGIEILNKEPVMQYTDSGVEIGITLLIVLILGIISLYVFEKMNNTYLLIAFFIITISSGIGLFVNAFINKEPSGRYTYEVTIDDDVSINEVYKHYYVIEKEGKKWILEDKESAE